MSSSVQISHKHHNCVNNNYNWDRTHNHFCHCHVATLVCYQLMQMLCNGCFISTPVLYIYLQTYSWVISQSLHYLLTGPPRSDQIVISIPLVIIIYKNIYRLIFSFIRLRIFPFVSWSVYKNKCGSFCMTRTTFRDLWVGRVITVKTCIFALRQSTF